ncbi:MAG: cytochrome-c peroxidase [Saprospiraceae bacterium]
MEQQYPQLMELPLGFPTIDEPIDNTFTSERWELGKRLFFDKALSLDSTISCASCHLPSLAFSDSLPISLGIQQRMGNRNSPSLANVAWHPFLMREGGVPTLEMQVFVPVEEHAEMGFNMALLAQRIAADSSYVALAALAYDRLPDPFVITRAIACFERSLISGWSNFDRYYFQQQPSALNDQEKQEWRCFSAIAPLVVPAIAGSISPITLLKTTDCTAFMKTLAAYGSLARNQTGHYSKYLRYAMWV